MSNVASLPIEADRYGACVRQIYIIGLDLTGVAMRAQVRLGGDVPGAPLIDLLNVTNGNAQGLRLVGVETVKGLPTSHVEMVINETAMEGLPYSGEIGDATALAWDWQVTLSGRKQRIAKGSFVITGDGVTGATDAPANRPSGWSMARSPIGGMRVGATLTFGDEIAMVTIDGADLVAPLADSATVAADQAASDRTRAELAAGAAQATARYFTTRAAGEAGSAANQAFATDDGAGSIVYYRKTANSSVEIGRAITPASLSAKDGASRVGFAHRLGLGRSALAKMRDTVSVKDFGAIGDGFEHPLSERFTTLAAAQVVYPAATSLDNLIDGLAIQAAIDAVESTLGVVGGDPAGRGRLYLPAGRYRCNTGSFKLPNFIEVYGDGPSVSIIDNQNTPATWPLVVNKSPTTCLSIMLRNISLHGGTHAVKINVSGEVQRFNVEDVAMLLQSEKNFECNKLFQLSSLVRVTLADASYGFYVPSHTTNAVSFLDCSFEKHRNASLFLRGVEGVTISGGRFEEGGTPEGAITASISGTTLNVVSMPVGPLAIGDLITGEGVEDLTFVTAFGSGTGGLGTYTISRSQSVATRPMAIELAAIDVTAARALTFESQVYFEAVHKKLFRERDSRNGVTFRNCHYTGASLDNRATWLPFDFDSDGIVSMEGRNNWGEAPIGAIARAAISGNGGDRIGRSATQQTFASTRSRRDVLSREKAVVSSARINLVRFQRAGASGALTNYQQAAGYLTINFGGLASGGNDRCVIKRFLVRVNASGFAAIGATIMQDGSGITAGGADVAVMVQTGPSPTDMMLEAQFSGFDPAALVAGNLNFRWDSISHSTSEDDFLVVTVQ